MFPYLSKSSFPVATANEDTIFHHFFYTCLCRFSVLFGIKDRAVGIERLSYPFGVSDAKLGGKIDLAYSFGNTSADAFIRQPRCAV